MSWRSGLVLIWLMASALWWAKAWGAEPEPEQDAVDIDLGEIEVEAERLHEPASEPAERETEKTVEEPSAGLGTTIIEINSHSADVASALQQVPGTAVLRSGGMGQLATAQLRGARGNQVQVTLDGMPFPSFGTVDLALLPQADVGSLAVQRGAHAGGGVGGSVDLRTGSPPRDATSQLVHEDLAVATGSHGLLRMQWSRHAPDAQWHYTHLQAENDYTFSRGGGSTATRLNNGAQLEQLWSSWEGGSLRWNAGVSHLERGVPGSAEFPTLQARLQETAAWAYGKSERSLFGVTWIESGFRDPQPYLHTGALVSHDQRWHGEYTAGALANRSDSGWGWRLRGDLADGDSSGPELRTRGGVDLLHRWHTGVDSGGLTADAGLIGSTDVGLSPTASITVERELNGDWRSYASTGYTVRHPDFSEQYYTDTGGVRGNPDLDPERLLSAEVGVRSAHDERSFECTAFWNHYANSILFLPVSAYLVQATNTGPATVAGAEAGWRLPVAAGLTWSGTTTWLPVAEMDDGTPLPQRSPLRVNTRLAWPHRDWSAYAAADYAARMPADLHGNLRIPARVLVDCGLGRDFDGDQLALAVTNLFDQDSRDSWNYPLPGREFNLTWRTSL